MLQIKMQVLAFTPMEKRTYQGRSYWQRSAQCFLDGKVAVHNVSAPDGEEGEAPAQRKSLEGLQSGYYMADLDPVAGDRGKLGFQIRNLTPVKQGAPAA